MNFPGTTDVFLFAHRNVPCGQACVMLGHSGEIHSCGTCVAKASFRFRGLFLNFVLWKEIYKNLLLAISQIFWEQAQTGKKSINWIVTYWNQQQSKLPKSKTLSIHMYELYYCGWFRPETFCSFSALTMQACKGILMLMTIWLLHFGWICKGCLWNSYGKKISKFHLE